MSQIFACENIIRISRCLLQICFSSRCLDCDEDIDIYWLTKLFNTMLMMKMIIDGWRKSTMVLFYKNNGVIQNYVNYKDKKRFSEMALEKGKKQREVRCHLLCQIDLLGFRGNWLQVAGLVTCRRIKSLFKNISLSSFCSIRYLLGHCICVCF